MLFLVTSTFARFQKFILIVSDIKLQKTVFFHLTTTNLHTNIDLSTEIRSFLQIYALETKDRCFEPLPWRTGSVLWL